MPAQALTTNPMLITIGSEQPVEQSLPQAVDRIVQALQPEKVILFGSYAYGQPTSDSDVDLLVIMETELPKRQRSWEVARLLIPRP